jgi:septum formation protein
MRLRRPDATIRLVQKPSPRLILASGSPRRRELLSHLGVQFEVAVSGFDEESLNHERAATLAKRLAAAKVAEVAALHPDALVLGADTIVVHRGKMLGKPVDATDARAMLQKLRGRVHRVTTGVALAVPGRRRPRAAHVTSRVRMRGYTDAEIDDTIARDVPFDKAGGYGIQDPVLRPVEHCEGCFCSVMGLPLWTAATFLRDAGIEVETDRMPERCASCPERTG